MKLAFGQVEQEPINDLLVTAKCVHYNGTNLVIVGIIYTEDTSHDCEEELDKQIASFRPTGIAVSTLESVLYQGGDIYRSDLVYLTK